SPKTAEYSFRSCSSSSASYSSSSSRWLIHLSVALACWTPAQLLKRFQHEGPLVEPWMRHLQTRLVDALGPVEEQVEVERSRSAGRPCSGPPELGLDRQQQLEERARAQGRLEGRRGVEEARLIRHRADGVRLAERRDGDDVDLGMRSQAGECTT